MPSKFTYKSPTTGWKLHIENDGGKLLMQAEEKGAALNDANGNEAANGVTSDGGD